MAERFHINCPLGPGPIQLDGAEAHHLAGVRRFRVGDAVVLFNGDGAEYPATVTEVAKRSVLLEISERRLVSVETMRDVEMAAPLPKGDRTAFLIEKLTELGVTRFVPLRTERSVIDPGEGKLEKMERAVIEASKQWRNSLMAIEPPIDWRDYVLPRGAEERYIAHLSNITHTSTEPDPSARSTKKENDLALAGASGSVVPVRIAVGPEGGFTSSEVAAAVANGWRPKALGPRILRVETAALVLAAHFTTLVP